MMRTLFLCGLAVAVGVTVVGCGGDTTATKADPKAAATTKLEAAKKIAEAVTKDPNGDEAFIALEEFRNTSMNPKDFPAESKEIIDLYKKRIEGKLKSGEISDQIKNEFTAFKSQFEKG
jgi:hypothetical protein